MSEQTIEIRKTFTQIEEIRTVAGAIDAGGALRRVAACMVIRNPFAGAGFVADLSALVEASGEIGRTLGEEALRLLSGPVESYGKAGMVGSDGEQEHINAALTSVFGDAFRGAIGGGDAWITSVTKPGIAGTIIDVPTAFKDEVWVRSHYDAMEVRVPDAPHPDELVIIAAVTSRGRINARVGGMSVAEAKGKNL